jgi:hypothetical protein
MFPLTANLFNNETKISSRDITNAFPLNSVFVNRAFTKLNYGETKQVTDYIATNSHDVNQLSTCAILRWRNAATLMRIVLIPFCLCRK